MESKAKIAEEEEEGSALIYVNTCGACGRVPLRGQNVRAWPCRGGPTFLDLRSLAALRVVAARTSPSQNFSAWCRCAKTRCLPAGSSITQEYEEGFSSPTSVGAARRRLRHRDRGMYPAGMLRGCGNEGKSAIKAASR